MVISVYVYNQNQLKMKKVFFVCMTVGLLATACDFFKSKTEVVDVTNVTADTTEITSVDTATQKVDSTATAVVEKTTTAKEVKK